MNLNMLIQPLPSLTQQSTQSEDEGVQGWGDDDQWESFEQGGWDVSKPVKSMSTGEFQDTGGWDDWNDDFDVPKVLNMK